MRTLTVLALILCSGVFGAAGSDTEELTGVLGGSLTVRCRYTGECVKYLHYLCKGDYWFSCSIVAQSTGSEKAVKKGRFKIEDNHKTCIFTVTITSIKEEDTGLYWCGTGRRGTDNTYQVKVTVSKTDPESDRKEKASTTISALLVTASVASGLRSSAAGEVNTIAVASGATLTPITSHSSYLVLQWQVKAALVGLIPLTGVITWIISRKRKKTLGGEGTQSDNEISFG